ncbi:MAG: class I SAM-dependent methyltransferase, partial [Blastocatellia bacterium]
MLENTEKFIAELRESLANLTFVKTTLGNYKGSDEHLQKIFVRLVDTKKGVRLLFQFRYDNRDSVKNFDFAEGVEMLRKHLESGFRSGHLFTTESDFQLEIGKKNSRLKTGKPTFKTRPSSSHDREKKHRIDSSAYYLKSLGITTDGGEIRAGQRDKWKQINKFVEILAGLYEKSALKNKTKLKIVDMGSGKGYLTFAAYDYFSNKLALKNSPPYEGGVAETLRGRGGSLPSDAAASLTVTGIDTRRELIDLCNDIARAGSFDGLDFVEGTIADFYPGDVDILIALHACDTATDDALFKGIAARTEIIVAAPCCHQEIRKQMKPPDMLAGILKHPVLLERTAET